MTKKEEKEKFNFNQAFKEIEEINQWFEKQDLDLEEALFKYERAMELIKKCKQKLQHSENKFKEIKEKFEDSEKKSLE